ncbi:Carbohydrate kinase, FGGY-like protein [Candidatus Sulfotelmatomonas gaucii]|uniref:Carbohydrate kinase, FGGY-like protein n=1 Tax=Candidatus Sulfuritelmatomonas gaucii TaxID=2043161 RepID=A0A2N9L832_9BACT|nr:Carbohydrate kinase, FGGY-like protein [Candidatus Sulfotelmatomonas gaucii]
MQKPARVAIDLGAESCRVSLLRWIDEKPSVEVIHRIPNGPVHRGDALYWALGEILAGLEEGLRKAAAAAPEGIASIGADSWSVDYVRLGPDGKMLREPFCYRDERTSASKEAADRIISSFDIYQRTGAYPLKLNTVYQLLADPAANIDARAPWVMFPEFVLYWLSGRHVAEYTNASHTGLVNLKTGNWDAELFAMLGLALEAAPPLVPTGTVLGPLQGPLMKLPAFRNTQIIAPATHDTASAIAGIPGDLSAAAYISSGTWSLVGTITQTPVTTQHAFDAGYTNIGAAGGGLLFHSLINSMWLLKQCMDAWAAQGRVWPIDKLVQEAAACKAAGGVLDMDAETLMLDSDMPQRINKELTRLGYDAIPDVAGNEPIFARTIFESLALRYASALANLEKMLGRKLERIHMIGGATRNKLLIELTERETGLKVEIGETESSTVGNLAAQLAASEAGGRRVTQSAIREWAKRLCQDKAC